MQASELAALLAEAVSPMRGETRTLKADVVALATDVVELGRAVTSLRERTAVLEFRAPVAGPPGRDGENGKDGKDGADGKDGVGFDYRGVWDAGATYRTNDIVTHNGSAWHCHSEHATSRPETDDGAKDWRLMVKRGEKGRDFRDTVAVRVGK